MQHFQSFPVGTDRLMNFMIARSSPWENSTNLDCAVKEQGRINATNFHF